MSLRSLLDLPIAMGWRHLLFANWPVDPGLVDAHVPDALTVDTHGGRAWLSVVPFTNVAVRPRGLPAWTGLPLPELNLRTYVTREGERSAEGAGPTDDGPAEDLGVYFFSLDADGILGVTGARLFHHLPYYLADMSLEADASGVEFRSRRRHPGARPCDFDARYEPVGDGFRSDPGSLERFLTKRHRFYTETPGGELRYAQIRHPPWTLYEASVDLRENEVFETNGFDTPESEPTVLYSPGVDVTASGSRRVE
ncbi:YqjF family protein [Halosimplex halophilum]|uniref:YqjF family protein n=1 Tax=Halosimplex halophilum TaxID=2559572 RepID=UPI001AE63095|nr:DUF2071 domain-containing protein [Halosimplex halophilum]